MAAITIRNLPDETHRALKARAAANNRSTEAEVREILTAAVTPQQRVRLGSLLAAIGADTGHPEIDVPRDQTSREPIDFS